ncbi:MAG: ABC transporter ATP-binding protein, partial [Spirochaetaceae bacterium]
MVCVSLTGVGKALGNDQLFEDVTVAIESGERVGLLGRNGSGKSTLLRLIAGELDPDDGTLVRSRGLRVERLDQRPALSSGTVDDYFTGDDDGRVRYRSFCTQLGISDPAAALGTLSGGMLKKVAIARCFAADADLMLLDEPTNHLDIDAILWLEQRLADATNGFVMVTHDRAMLDSVCTTILEVADRRVYRHDGNYSTYLERQADRENERQSAEQRRVSILRRELEWLKRGPKARTGKDKGRSARIAGMMADAPESSAEMGALPVASRRLGKMVLEIEGVAKRYGDQTVISDFSYQFSRGERVGVIGPNGSGKTTLLDVIAGRIAPDRGLVRPGETAVFGYFDQTGRRVDGRTTVLDYIKSHAERIPVGDYTVSAEQFLERFLFPWSMFAQPLELLSGGEFRRLYLVRVLAGAPNFLLLDEPTNDLDIETLRVLEQYLDEWNGCLLLVSHDRALLNRLTDSLLVFDGCGGIRSIV